MENWIASPYIDHDSVEVVKVSGNQMNESVIIARVGSSATLPHAYLVFLGTSSASRCGDFDVREIFSYAGDVDLMGWKINDIGGSSSNIRGTATIKVNEQPAAKFYIID